MAILRVNNSTAVNRSTSDAKRKGSANPERCYEKLLTNSSFFNWVFEVRTNQADPGARIAHRPHQLRIQAGVATREPEVRSLHFGARRKGPTEASI